MLPRRRLLMLSRGALALALAAATAAPSLADVLDFLAPLGPASRPAPAIGAPAGLFAPPLVPPSADGRAPAVGAPGSGAATNGLSTTPMFSWESNVANAFFGRTPVTAGDVNGDGFSDVVAMGGGSTDALYLFLGSASGPSLAPGYPVVLTGRSGGAANAAGDLNGDGFADIAIGFPGATAGRVRVYYGNAAGLDTASPYEYFQNFSTYYAMHVGPAGDLNGDGFDDLVVGSPVEGTWINCGGSGTNQGRVDVFYGSAAGIANPNWVLWGCSYAANGRVGAAATGAGDVNGDGYSDLVIGAPGATGLGHQDRCGSVWVVYGSASGLPLTTGYANVGSLLGATRIDPPADLTSFGASACAAGDVNGDGYADVAVGAPYDDTGSTDGGRARVYAGSAGGLTNTILWETWSTIPGVCFGTSVAPGGDFNGDGKGDLIVGDLARVWPQASGPGVLFSYVSFASTHPQWSATAGDVNGDGLSEIVLGDDSFTNGQAAEGRIQIFAGSGDGPATSAAWNVSTVYENPNLGWSVASAGDVNGDGLDDVLVGAPTWDNMATPSDLENGIIFLYMGSLGGLSTTPSWYYVGATGDQAGVSVCGLGDVNGDGYADFAAGAHQPGVGNGKALVFHGSGSGLSTTPARVLGGLSFDSQFGAAISGGDFNGDGYADLAVGSPNHDGSSAVPPFVTYTDGGGAFMYLGGSSGIAASYVWAAQGTQNGEHFGAALNGFADITADGRTDLVVGSPGLDIGSPFAIVDCGRVTEYDGGTTPSILTYRQAINGGPNEAFGSCVANAGDVNGDGYGDVVVGAPYANPTLTGQGRAAVHAGSSSGLQAAPHWSQLGSETFGAFGSSVAGMGDANGDGLSDVLIGGVFENGGGAQDRGTARIYPGPLHSGVAPIWTAFGPGALANMGHCVANAGDVNGDGWADVICGEPGYTFDTNRQGRAEIFLGGQGTTRLHLSLARRTTAGPNIVPMGAAATGVPPVILNYAPSAAGRTKYRMEWDVRSSAGLPSAPIAGLTPAWLSTSGSAWGQLGAAYVPVFGMQTGVPYSWRVRARFHNPYFPSSRWVSPVRSGVREYDMRSPGSWVDVAGSPQVSPTLALSAPTPNPARDASSVAFELPRGGRVSLDVVDVQGRRVRTLIEGERAAGSYRAAWDGRDADGHGVAAGVYFYRLRAGGEQANRKLALVH